MSGQATDLDRPFRPNRARYLLSSGQPSATLDQLVEELGFTPDLVSEVAAR